VTVGAELSLIDDWLDTTLKGDAAVASYVGTRVYPDVAPITAAYPFIVFQHQSSSDTKIVGSQRILVEALYVVKVTAQGDDFTALRPVAEAVDSALDRSYGTISGGSILICTRERPFRMAEVSDGKTYRHLGGEYRIHVQG